VILTLLVYAMYAIIAILIISKWVTSRWTESIQTQRACEMQLPKAATAFP